MFLKLGCDNYYQALRVLAVVLVSVWLFGCSKKETATSGVVIKIGNVAPLTGPDSYLGKDNENGARLAVEEINRQGLTINGKAITLELLGEDDAGDPKLGTQVAQKLVDSKVVAVVGHLNSGVTIPAIGWRKGAACANTDASRHSIVRPPLGGTGNSTQSNEPINVYICTHIWSIRRVSPHPADGSSLSVTPPRRRRSRRRTCCRVPSTIRRRAWPRPWWAA